MRQPHRFGSILLCICAGWANTLAAQGSAVKRLKPGEDYHAYFESSRGVKTAGGIEFFLGIPKGLNAKYGTDLRSALLMFDPASGQVSRALSEETIGQYFPWNVKFPKTIVSFDATPDGRHLVIARHNSDNTTGPVTDLLWADVGTSAVRVLLHDRRKNYAPSVSPDGEFIAFYATDADYGYHVKDPSNQNGGCVMEVATGKVSHPIPPYHVIETEWLVNTPPKWLDNDRVFFCNLRSEDSDFVKSVLGSAEHGIAYSYFAVVSRRTQKTKYIMDTWPTQIAEPAIDPDRQVIYYSDLRRLFRVDYDLENRAVVAQAPPGQILVLKALQNGEPQYEFHQPSASLAADFAQRGK